MGSRSLRERLDPPDGSLAQSLFVMRLKASSAEAPVVVALTLALAAGSELPAGDAQELVIH
jgi:hypothetical protein